MRLREVSGGDLLALVGLAMVGYGLWQIWPPLSWIVMGGVALWVALLLARKAQLSKDQEGVDARKV